MQLAEDAAPTPGRLAHSFDQTADMLGVSRSTVYALVASGDLVAIKIGQRRRAIAHDDLVSYVDRLRAEAVA